MNQHWAGIDIGGANIKIATEEKAFDVPFELWRQPDKLLNQLSRLLNDVAPFERLAVTMTGELADCFESRESGVKFICDSVTQAADAFDPVFYLTNGRFVSVDEAKSKWRLAAASNWHAIANYVADFHCECIVIDIGSTTTDIVPISKGQAVHDGSTDFQRLQNRELVYTGVIRTPVCVISSRAKFNDAETQIAAEFFATMQDVYLLLGKIPESDSNRHTADGRPANVIGAKRRLSKMLCSDLGEISDDHLLEMATELASKQKATIADCIVNNAALYDSCKFVILGEGSWLAEEIINECFGSDVEIHQFPFSDAQKTCGAFSIAGAAYALVCLAATED